MTVTDLLHTWAGAMTAAGVPYDQQLTAFWQMGIIIGRGGRGGIGSDTAKTCPYCGATGNGGYGGFCPSTGHHVTILELIAP